jgi:hypothetical protein
MGKLDDIRLLRYYLSHINIRLPKSENDLSFNSYPCLQ